MIENQIIFQNEYNIRYMRENKKLMENCSTNGPKEHEPLRIVYH